MKALAAILIGVAAVLVYVLLSSRPTASHRAHVASDAETTEAPISPPAPMPPSSPVLAPVPPTAAAAIQAAPSETASALDEPSAMSLLRELGDSAPSISLAVAQEANRRFPNSADAAERGFYICKSLVNLERFYEAREEARVMVQRFRGTPWAADVERHLLVSPLGLPEDATR